MIKTNKVPVFKLDGLAQDKKIHIVLQGFANNAPISATDIAEQLNSLPPSHLNTLRQIEYQGAHKHHWLSNMGLVKKRGGYYSLKERKITLYGTSSKELLIHTLLHEMGHAVFFHHLTASLRKQWVTEVYRHRRGRFVSLYAKRNAGEDFAESYAFFVLEPETLKAISEKNHFFTHNVFQEIKLAEQQKQPRLNFVV